MLDASLHDPDQRTFVPEVLSRPPLAERIRCQGGIDQAVRAVGAVTESTRSAATQSRWAYCLVIRRSITP
eukprot:331586-Chlamydomonas_euryale.AAC.4